MKLMLNIAEYLLPLPFYVQAVSGSNSG